MVDLAQYPGYQGWGLKEMEADFATTGGAGKAAAGGTSSGGGAPLGIDESQLPSTLDYITKLNATEDTAFNDLIMAMKARKSPLDVYTGLEEASGLPEMRTGAVSLAKSIADLEDTLETIEPDVAARSRESLMTEAQRRGLVTHTKQPLLEKMGKFTTGLGRLKELIGLTGQDVGTKANLYMQGEEQKLEPLKMKYTALVDRNARNLSGFTADKETKLQILMDKLHRQQQLSDQEWQLANSLTADEKEYTRQLQQAAAEAGYKVTGSESNDQLLGIIGTQAAKKIASSGSGAATKKAALTELANDADKGMSLQQAMTKYAGKLSADEIVATYTGSTHYGTPQEDWAQQILGTYSKPESTSSSGFTVNADGSITFD